MLGKVSSQDRFVCAFLEVERSLRKENDGSLLNRTLGDWMILSWQELFRDRKKKKKIRTFTCVALPTVSVILKEAAVVFLCLAVMTNSTSSYFRYEIRSQVRFFKVGFRKF